jgi:cholera toxin transcriptional activator
MFGWFRRRHADIVAPAGRTKIRAVTKTRSAAKLTTDGQRPPVLHYASSMAVPQPNGKIARFGVFEADLSAGELRKNGVKQRLTGQPFQVLTLLLERAGEVVTREELQQKLWPSDTFVDFDHSLNTAINKVREALGDSASSPRFVETLARRGYRFIAPVQDGSASIRPPLSDPPPVIAVVPAPAQSSVTLHPDLEVPIPHRGLTRGLFALIQLMYLIFYLAALFRLQVIQTIADSFLPPWGSTALTAAVLVTAGVGIPLRCYLMSSVGFDYQRLGEKFRQLFPFVLAMDQLWAVAPFLLMQKIGLGAAFAASAALLYLPFSERTLIRMAYLEPPKN